MQTCTVLGYAAASPDADLRAALPMACADLDRSEVPLAWRRRASQATLLAFNAAAAACRMAGRLPSALPALFATVGGEIQVTDVLCRELAKDDGVISPTAFHNTVHNTAAGYWSIAHGCTAASGAMAGGLETFAMALLESWGMLATTGGEILLVCYDEAWPDYLAAPLGAYPFAAALVLSARADAGGLARLVRPRRTRGLPLPERWQAWLRGAPALAAVPLLANLAKAQHDEAIALSGDPLGWHTALHAGSLGAG